MEERTHERTDLFLERAQIRASLPFRLDSCGGGFHLMLHHAFAIRRSRHATAKANRRERMPDAGSNLSC
jgi:hypothetical protein